MDSRLGEMGEGMLGYERWEEGCWVRRDGRRDAGLGEMGGGMLG